MPRVLAGVIAFIAALTTSALTAPPSHADVTTISYDNLRTGWDKNEAGLSPASVSATDFGKLFATQLDGQIYAQPIVSKGVLLVATENNKVYGLNPVTGAITWSRSVGAAWPASSIGCGDLVPNIGITATPVVDQVTGTAYFTAKVNDGATAATPHWYLHAINIVTGAERPGFPHTIQGHPSNDPTNTFNAKTAMQRPGLLLMGGVVYAGFASHCDYGPYVGYVVGVNATTGAQTALWSTETGTSNTGAGIWQSGGGLVSDGLGRIFFATGNGTAPAPGAGTNPPGQFGESVVRLQVNAGGTLSAKDIFSPVNATLLNRDDTDFGSGGPLAIPDGYGTAAHPHLMVQVGKDGRVFLLDRDKLGGVAQGPGGGDAVLQVNGPYQGVWGHPAFWGGDGGYVYMITNNGPLRAFRIGKDAAGNPSLAGAGTTTTKWGYTSGSPIVTSNGTASGSALIWAINSSGPTGANSQLQAYDPVPVAGVLQLRYSVPVGNASKFAVPATDNGRVYVGNRDGVISGFGRPTVSALNGTGTDFGFVGVGQEASRTLTFTASKAVTVNAVTAGAPFTVSSALPVTLAAGAKVSVTVTAKPTIGGQAVGTLMFSTTAGQVPFDVRAYGAVAGVSAGPTSLSFGQVPTSGTVTSSVSITNTNSLPTAITSATLPTAPFAVSSVPVAGTILGPGASVSVPVMFSPKATGTFTSQLTVQTATGSVTVPLSGTGVAGAPRMDLTPTVVDFGQVPVGSPARNRTFKLTNTGNLVLTITKAAPPTAPFNVATPISEGQQLEPGDSLTISAFFQSAAVGTFTGTYLVTSNDGTGPHAVTYKATATPAPVAVADPASGRWTLNGSATRVGGTLTLTPAKTFQAGSAVYAGPVAGQGLHARFTAKIGGGHLGGDGMTFAVLDATKTTAKSVGSSGGALGWAPLAGFAVTLDTYQNPGEPSGNFVGVATGSGGAGNAQLKYVATSNLPTSLRTGTHLIDVTTSLTASTVTVSVDGVRRMVATVPIPPSARLAFTGGTGGYTDIHQVSGVTVTQTPRWAQIIGLNGKCVDVRSGGTANGTPVQIYTCNGSAAQLWAVAQDNSLQAQGKCLDAVHAGVTNGTKLQLYTCNGTAAQTWVLRADRRIYNPKSGKCIDDSSRGKVNSTQLQIWSCTGGTNQYWTYK
ncbi:ricin-type beta-trefoil lectin domain protein [Calidifontibacter terrae]